MPIEYLHSYVLSQVLGFYLVIMAIIMIGRAAYFRNVIAQLNPDSFGVILAGAYGILFGLFLITIHSIWGAIVVNLVTIVSWIILIKSLLLLSFPARFISYSQKLACGHGYYVVTVISGLVGILLLANGYHIFK